MYEHLRQHATLPMLNRHSFQEIEKAVDRVKELPDRVSMRREKDMLFEQRLGKASRFKAKALKMATIVREHERCVRGGDVDEQGRKAMADA